MLQGKNCLAGNHLSKSWTTKFYCTANPRGIKKNCLDEKFNCYKSLKVIIYKLVIGDVKIYLNMILNVFEYDVDPIVQWVPDFSLRV